MVSSEIDLRAVSFPAQASCPVPDRASALYVYAITEKAPALPVGVLGFGDAHLEVFVWRSLAAVTSQVDPTQVSPNAERLLRHAEIVEALCQATQALPVRYGTVLPEVAALAKVLDERYETLKGDLTRLGGKVEVGLRVLWNPHALGDYDRSAAPSTSQPSGGSSHPPHEATLTAGGRGTNYLRARQAEQQRQDALRARANDLARRLQSRCSPM